MDQPRGIKIDWDQIKTTLLGGVIDDEQAGIIVALLQTANQNGVFTSENQIENLVDGLKLISIEKGLPALRDMLNKIADSINVEEITISHTEMRVKWWRTLSTYLFGAGVLILTINAIVPIPFQFIANTVFATGQEAATNFFNSFAGTSASAATEAAMDVAASAAAATTGSPNMVAGPSMDALNAVGSVFYTLSAATLSKCVDVATGLASSARGLASSACQLISMSNAEKVADLAVQSATIKGIVFGIDKSWDFAIKLNRGEFDAAMAAFIDNGVIDEATNTVINAILESSSDIQGAKVGIKMDTRSNWDKQKKFANRGLDVPIKRMIDVNLDQFIDDIVKATTSSMSGSNKKSMILLQLSPLDDEEPNPVVVKQLIQKYGIAVVIMYNLKYNQSKRPKRGNGYESGTLSQPELGSEKMPPLPRSISLPDDFKLTSSLNPYVVKHEKTANEILKETGYYPDSKPRFEKYIPDLMGDMNEALIQVLSQPMDPGSSGNLYTAIAKNYLTGDQQMAIVHKIIAESKRLQKSWDDRQGIRLAEEIARDVRPMILSADSMEIADIAKVPATAENLVSTAAAMPVQPSSTRRRTPAQEALANATFLPGTQIGERVDKRKPGEPAGGRKSQRHKKRRSTLKRRRMKRRRTRKGKKRRHTKKRR